MDMSPTSPKDGGTSPVQQQEQRPAPSPMPMSPDEVISEEDELKIPPHQPTPSPPPPPAVEGGSGTSSGEVVGGAVGGGNQPNMSPQQQDQLSPQVEEASIQQSLEQNKESLKRKLLLRRSVNELVDQGIYPPLKTPGAFAEQRKHLQRAQTGDLLKHKIQHRPDRQALVQQHILEDTNVAPSLQDRQRQLKRARLQDSLSDRIANRPGPLELVEDNILHTDPEIKHALKEGKLQYEKTAENAHAEDEDALFSDASSQSSASSSTNKTQKKSPLSSTSSVSIPSPPDITPFLQKLHQQQTSISSAISAASVVTASEASSVANISYAFTTTSNSASSRTCVSSPPTAASFSSRSPGSNSSIGSSTGKLNRTKKFTKPKASTSKNKTIKFHEYKGPPSVSKSNKDNEDHTPYHVMLQQQQLFLQWQLENKKPDGTTVLPMSVPFNMSGQQIITTNMTTPGIPAGQIITHAAVGNHATAVGTAVLTDAQGQAQIHAATPIIAAHPTAKIIQQVATGLVPQQKVLARPAQPGSTYTIHKHVATVMPAVHSAVQATPVQLQMAATPAAPATPLPVAAPPPPPPPLPPPPTTASVTASAFAPPTTPVPPPAPPLPPAKKTIPSHTRPKCLEEMKVPELRAELKKRNLTVSGAKPQLIEKLRPYIDSIFGCTLTSGTSTPISNRTAVVSSGTSTSIATSPASSTTGPPSNNPSVSSSLASPASVQSSVGSVINIQPISPASSAATNDEAQTATSMISSPPISPVSSAAASESVSTTFKSMDTSSFADAQDGGVNLHLNASFGSLPSMLSGDQYSPGDSSMDVPSPLALTAGAQSAVNLNSSTGNIQSMLVDQQSRPSSVAPMDIELTGTTLRDGNNKAVGATSSTLVSPPAPPPLPQQTTTGKRKQKKKQVTATAKQVMVPDSVGVFQQQPTVISAAQQQLSNQSTRVSQSVAVVDPMPQQMFTVSNASKTLDQQVTGTIDRSAMNGDQQNQGNVAVNIQQQQQIEKLQRELHRTQMELQQAQHALKNQNRTQIVYQRHPLSHLPGIPASGTLDKNQQLQDIITHPPLTHPPPVMSQIQLHTPATSQPVTNTRLASSRSAQVRQIVGHLTSQAHLFIKPSLGSVVTTQGVGIPAGSSATIKQTLANYLRQNSSTQKAKTATSATMTNSGVQGSGAGKKKTAKSRGIAPVSVTSSVNSVSMSSSVPSSPLHQTATTIHRSATNPLFMTEDVSNQQQTSDVSASKGGSAMTSPLGLAGDGAPTTVMDQPPPKYDEAIKSKQCMLLQQQAAAAAAALSGTLKSAPTGTAAGDGSSSFTNSPSPTHTDHTVEDVLEILIQSGELPATIASDDPALLIPKSEDEDEDPSGDNLSSAASLMNSADIPDSLHSLNISDMSALSSHHNQATDPAFNMHLADSGIFDAVTQSLPSASLSDDASTSFATMSHPGSNMSDKSLLDGPLSAVDTDSLAAGLADSLQNMQDLPFLSVDHSMMDWSDSDLINNLTCDPVSSTVNGVNSDRVMVDGSDEDTRVKQELGNVEDMYLRHTQNTVTSMLNLPAHTSPPTITRDSNNPNLGNLQSIADDIKPHVTHTLPSAGGGGGVTNHMDHVTPHLDLNGVGGSDDPAGTSGGMSLEMCDWLDAMMPDSENSTVGVGSSPSSSIATTSSGDGGGGMCTALPSDQIIDSGTSGRPPSATVAANSSTAAVVALDDNQTNNNVNFSMLTPKTEDVLELFNMEEEDLYAQTDLGSSLTFEKALDTSHTAN